MAGSRMPRLKSQRQRQGKEDRGAQKAEKIIPMLCLAAK